GLVECRAGRCIATICGAGDPVVHGKRCPGHAAPPRDARLEAVARIAVVAATRRCTCTYAALAGVAGGAGDAVVTRCAVGSPLTGGEVALVADAVAIGIGLHDVRPVGTVVEGIGKPVAVPVGGGGDDRNTAARRAGGAVRIPHTGRTLDPRLTYA